MLERYVDWKNEMDEMVSELHIIGNDGESALFSDCYSIPVYQRGYAWGEEQLVQLIEDIGDIGNNLKYYLGSLIVSRNDNGYEVVDGQQRLTSLYLLLRYLKITVQYRLTFDCRDRSNYTMKYIDEVIEAIKLDNVADLVEPGVVNAIEPSIVNAIRIIHQEIKRKEESEKEFKAIIKNNLRKTILYRIEIPQHTNLNRYFEIMNTRGEQLEQHDILKARLMSYFVGDESDSERELFAIIWDACSDMTGYVQMHFNSDVRILFFGNEWNDIPSNWKCLFDKWCKYKKVHESVNNNDGQKSMTIKNIISEPIEKTGTLPINDDVVRFESIVDFPFFLLHVLSVYAENYSKQLDDRKLLTCFSDLIDSLREDKDNFSRNFIITLLRTRCIFDKYVIKREFSKDNSDGQWSLKSICKSGNTADYVNTSFKKKGKWDKTYKKSNLFKKNLMIQAALRVSYTSPRSMHWITYLLKYLSRSQCDVTCLYVEAERIAAEAVKTQFLMPCEEEETYKMGVATPHIVFNFLDYLLWCDSGSCDNFVFEFRNSVEHWYPRNPSDGSFARWEDVDMFGNLCLIQRDVNSKFSNRSPSAKKKDWGDMIAKGSLKLREMNKYTVESDEKDANQYWREIACKEHHDRMIARLRKACQEYQ